MRVLIPSALQSYTGAAWVSAEGASLDALLRDLDRQFPGIRFRMVDERRRIRRHIRFFLNGEMLFDPDHPLPAGGELHIVQALSGG
ncbi:MAG: MoaD/ThiS family protein [Dechloromonas sp.]|nr:MAG: MoaD/ThiS family protein [Dechloromonas sp.]